MKTGESKAKLRERHSRVCRNPQALCCPLRLGLCVCVCHSLTPFPRSDSFKHLGETEERVPDRQLSVCWAFDLISPEPQFDTGLGCDLSAV